MQQHTYVKCKARDRGVPGVFRVFCGGCSGGVPGCSGVFRAFRGHQADTDTDVHNIAKILCFHSREAPSEVAADPPTSNKVILKKPADLNPLYF